MRAVLISVLFLICAWRTTSAQRPTVTPALASSALALAPTITAAPREPAPAPSPETIAPNRLVVVYRSGAIPADSAAIAARAGATIAAHLPRFGISSLLVHGDTNTAIGTLLAEPEVSTVLRDRIVQIHTLHRVSQVPAISQPTRPAPLPRSTDTPIARPDIYPEVDSFYNPQQAWATQLAGGFGNNIPGGPATGPWNTSLGQGVRIAILDTGVDANHPDIAPHLALNLSEIDTTTLPSPCDDGSPQDQMGHGTFTASLAAAAQGINTGMIIGVAPQATLLNIKVVQRMPAATGATVLAQCEAGTASGLLSWVLLGIQDAVANHANIVSLSLGTLVDVTTGDGAGWKAQMDAVTYAAAQAGTVLIASLGNDSLNLAGGQFVELPAQARDVLPVVASTNPACAENPAPNATCVPGPVNRASYSNYDPALSVIAAPGGSYPQGTDLGITGAVRGACSSGLTNTTDGLPSTDTPSPQSLGCFSLGHTPYVQAVGTSAAAPLVAGAAAILRAAHPTWTPSQIISALLTSAAPTGNLTEPELNLPAALTLQ